MLCLLAQVLGHIMWYCKHFQNLLNCQAIKRLVREAARSQGKEEWWKVFIDIISEILLSSKLLAF